DRPTGDPQPDQRDPAPQPAKWSHSSTLLYRSRPRGDAATVHPVAGACPAANIPPQPGRAGLKAILAIFAWIGPARQHSSRFRSWRRRYWLRRAPRAIGRVLEPRLRHWYRHTRVFGGLGRRWGRRQQFGDTREQERQRGEKIDRTHEDEGQPR